MVFLIINILACKSSLSGFIMHHTFQLYQKNEQLQRQAVKLEVLGIDNYKKWESKQGDQTILWAKACGFSGESGEILWVPSEQMTIKKVIWVMGVKESPWVFAKLMNLLPEGYYSICSQSLEKDYPWHNMLLAWGLASYRFNRYKLGQGKSVYLEIPEDSINKDLLLSELRSTFLVRDLVNTPAEDCTPAFLVEAIEEVADQQQATYFSYQGQDLLDQGFPLVHAVGRASQYQPQVAGFTWGDPGHPRVVLVGKGVCFDSGGLQIKPHQGMATMKKDMGGAAHMLALAQMIMQHKIPVYLELWVAAVENSVAGNAFKPGDVFFARNGLSVEIGHTDAEGRLCLADLLAKVTEDACDLVIDYATLSQSKVA